MAIPESIKKKANKIRNEVYGKDVREALASGIEEAGDIADQANTKSNDAVEQVDNIQAQVNQLVVEGDSSVEAAQARVDEKGQTHATLKDRIDDGFTKVNTQLEQITVNARSFGATGNGLNDDYQAIQDAIDYVNSLKVAGVPGGRVYIPAGEYRISKPPELYSDIELYGADRFVTKIVPDFLGEGVQPNVFIASGTESNRLKNIVIHDIGIDGRNRTEYLGQWGRIQMRYVDNFKAYNVHGYMVGNLFDISGCEYFEITNISVHDSYCAVHLRSDTAENMYGTITHVIANKTATVIDFGGGGDSIVVSHCVGNQGGFIHDEEEALDVGGARNIKISDSIFSGYRVGAMVKGEAGKEWDNIQFNNVDFYDFWRFGIIAIPGSESACGEIRINNVNLKSEDMELDSNAYGIEIRGNVKKAQLSNVNVDVNAGGLHAYSFDDFQIYGLQIKSGERGLFFAGIGGRDSGTWNIDGLIVDAGERAVELSRTKSTNMLRNFHIKGGTLGLAYTNVSSPSISNGIIEEVSNHAISFSFQASNIYHLNTLNSLDLRVSDVTVKNWGSQDSPNRSGIIFSLPSVSGTFKNVRLSDIDFIINDDSILNKQIGIDWNGFSENKIDYSWFDGITLYNVPNNQTFETAKGENNIERIMAVKSNE